MLGSLTGGGGLSASTSVASKSGDLTTGYDSSFQYQGAFQVGGSGSQSQDAAAGLSSGGSQTMQYVIIGAVALVAVALILRR
jgi:hypothetical protein